MELANSPTQTAPVTARGTVLGTLPYMAPEQLEGKDADARTDLWALGAILYEMVTGRRAFEADSEVSLIGRILNTEPPAVATLQPLTPPALERVERKCLAMAPDDRWDTAHDVADELRWIARTSGGSTAVPGGAGTVTSGRRPRWRAAAVGVAALIVVVSLFVWLAPRLCTRPPSAAGVPGISSVAVLPFDNLIYDAAQDYFVDGMHDALITGLARLGTVKVTSRSLVMRYKEQRAALADMARELRVDALIEGFVLRAGNQVRITAQLIHGKTDEHLWAWSCDRDPGDVLILLSEVSRAIAGEIQATLTPGRAGAPLSKPGTIARVKPEAYEAYLRGRHEANSAQAPGEVSRGLPFFEEAVRLDPTFAAAQSAIAGACAAQWFAGQALASEAVPLVRTAA